ncbi:MAG: pyridoxamine 5'-phosphate oxidase [Myxococcota bacterium]|nr:pyridoxamine 5'-phosphate oxidase [Myxococcota bacterium]
MADREEAAGDPLEKFQRWYAEAQTGVAGKRIERRIASAAFALLRKAIPLVSSSANLFRPDVATLATVDANDAPAARSVLFRGLVEGGFSFYTDYESSKGRELERNPSAVLLFYWSLPPRQVRVDGRVGKLSRELARAYWKSRTRANQAASAAARQSSILRDRQELVERARRIEETYGDEPIPCPESWGGYCLVPERVEFWEGRRDWLHDRERYTRRDGRWTRVQLAP